MLKPATLSAPAKAPPARRTRRAGPDESDHQKRLMRLVRQELSRLPCKMPELAYFHSVPNSTKTNITVARRMVAEGVVPGVHDLHWDLCRGGYTGLTIEMKQAGETLRKEQKKFAAFYRSQGALSLRCMTGDEAWRAVLWYYGLPKTPPSPHIPLPDDMVYMAAPTEHRDMTEAAKKAMVAKRRATLAKKAGAKASTPAAKLSIKYPAKG